MPLTAAKIRSAEPLARPYKIADGQGLFLHVATTGTKTFRMAFRFAGKEKLLVLGRVPDVSLADARVRRDDARQQLRRGEDPSRRGREANDVAAGDAPTFADVARAWLADQADRWSPVHMADVAKSLDLHVLPALGAMPIASIDAPTVLRVLREVEQGGSIETARRLRQRISAVFARAIAEGTIEIDPAARVTKALKRPAEARHHPAALTIADARAVLVDVDDVAGAEAAKRASRFLALTAVRWAAVRGAEWGEIEGVDWSTGHVVSPTWRVPAERMKLARSKKSDAGNDHLVPLAPAAVQLLRAAWAVHLGDANLHARDGMLIFPGRGAAALGENALSDLYGRAGLQGRHSPHGWRASFATILNEARPADRAAIDLALAHAPKDKVEAAYNRSEQLGRRRDLFDTWAEMLVGPAKSGVAPDL